MTDLERRALLGDKQAQEECTRRGILLPCPFCGNEPITEDNWVFCGFCGIAYEELDAGLSSSAWNTRPAPPIGRCEECLNSPDISTRTKGMRWCRRFRAEVKADGHCDGFKPKGGEENEAD